MPGNHPDASLNSGVTRKRPLLSFGVEENKIREDTPEADKRVLYGHIEEEKSLGANQYFKFDRPENEFGNSSSQIGMTGFMGQSSLGGQSLNQYFNRGGGIMTDSRGTELHVMQASNHEPRIFPNERAKSRKGRSPSKDRRKFEYPNPYGTKFENGHPRN